MTPRHGIRGLADRAGKAPPWCVGPAPTYDHSNSSIEDRIDGHRVAELETVPELHERAVSIKGSRPRTLAR